MVACCYVPSQTRNTNHIYVAPFTLPCYSVRVNLNHSATEAESSTENFLMPLRAFAALWFKFYTTSFAPFIVLLHLQAENYRLMKYLLLLGLNGFLLQALPAHAQTQFAGWLSNFSTFKLNERLSIHFDGQLRSSGQLEHIQTLLLRTGLNVHIKKNLTATAGYAFIHNYRVVAGVEGYAPEHRLFQQLLIGHPLFNTSLTHRLRLEQRFIARSEIENNSLKNKGNDYANRFRYFFRTMLPLAEKLEAKTLFIALQNEVFLNLGDKSPVNGEFFDQNRAYIAAGYRLHNDLDLELGYMNQYINGRDKAFTNNHVLQLATYLRL